jgi:UDP-glucose 6-dehydrogenase
MTPSKHLKTVRQSSIVQEPGDSMADRTHGNLTEPLKYNPDNIRNAQLQKILERLALTDEPLRTHLAWESECANKYEQIMRSLDGENATVKQVEQAIRDLLVFCVDFADAFVRLRYWISKKGSSHDMV